MSRHRCEQKRKDGEHKEYSHTQSRIYPYISHSAGTYRTPGNTSQNTHAKRTQHSAERSGFRLRAQRYGRRAAEGEK